MSQFVVGESEGMSDGVFDQIHGADPSKDFDWFEEIGIPDPEHLLQDDPDWDPSNQEDDKPRSGLFAFMSRRRNTSSSSRSSSFAFGRSRGPSAAQIQRKASRSAQTRNREFSLSEPVPVEHCQGSAEDKNRFLAIYRSAQSGQLLDIYTLAKMYEMGHEHVIKDTDEAVRWYVHGSNVCNSMDCEFALGALYATGHRGRTEKNAAEALHWYMKAAERGHWVAQFRVGLMYLSGDGLDKTDAVAAFLWFKKAGKQGYGAASSNVGVMYMLGVGAEKNEKKGLKWMKKGANTGVPVALHNLAVVHKYGWGVTKNERKSVDYLSKALSNETVDGISESVSAKALEVKGLFLYRGISIVPVIIVQE